GGSGAGRRRDLIAERMRLLEEKVSAAVPEMVSNVVSVQSSGTSGRSAARGEIRISLTPAAERERSNLQIAEALRTELEGAIPGIDVRVRAPQGQFILERLLSGAESVTVEVRGYALDT